MASGGVVAWPSENGRHEGLSDPPVPVPSDATHGGVPCKREEVRNAVASAPPVSSEELLLAAADLDRIVSASEADTPNAAAAQRQIHGVVTEVALRGVLRFEWAQAKPLIRWCVRDVLTRSFTDGDGDAPEVGPPPPHTQAEVASRTMDALGGWLDALDGWPFTAPRLCELLIFPRQHHSKLAQWAWAVGKCLKVTSTASADAAPPPPPPLADLEAERDARAAEHAAAQAAICANRGKLDNGRDQAAPSAGADAQGARIAMPAASGPSPDDAQRTERTARNPFPLDADMHAHGDLPMAGLEEVMAGAGESPGVAPDGTAIDGAGGDVGLLEGSGGHHGGGHVFTPNPLLFGDAGDVTGMAPGVPGRGGRGAEAEAVEPVGIAGDAAAAGAADAVDAAADGTRTIAPQHPKLAPQHSMEAGASIGGEGQCPPYPIATQAAAAAAAAAATAAANFAAAAAVAAGGSDVLASGPGVLEKSHISIPPESPHKRPKMDA